MPLTSPFINPNIPLQSVFELNAMNERTVEKLVIKMAPRFQRSVISVIASQLGAPVLQQSGNRIYEIYRQPNDYPAATIASRTAVGTDLVLTWSDPSFQAIRTGNLINSTSGCIGYVKSISAGTATISFFVNQNGSTAFTASDFVVGQLARDGGDIGNIYDRESKRTLFTVPLNYKNFIGQINETVAIDFESANQITYLKASDGTMMYAHSKVMQAMQRMQQVYSQRMVGEYPAVNNGGRIIGGSLIWQIKNQGGTSRSFTSLTEVEFWAAADQFRAQGGYTGGEILVVCGTRYLAEVQKNVFKQYVTTAGTTNVIGGTAVKGIDAYEYAYAGVKFKFVVDNFMDNPMVWGNSLIYPGDSLRSGSALWMSTEPAQVETGGTAPFIQDYYYGVADIIETEVDGMIDTQGKPVRKGNNGKLAAAVETSLNKTTQLMNPASCFYHYVQA